MKIKKYIIPLSIRGGISNPNLHYDNYFKKNYDYEISLIFNLSKLKILF